MCIIVAKYFKEHGWVLAKNRDQNYVSKVSFNDELNKNVGEILLLFDHDTGYREGINHNDMAIATTSLTPDLKDETDREDGDLIEKALKLKSPEEAAKFLTSKKLTGYIFIASSEKLILIEAATSRHDKEKKEYKSTMRVIPKTETVVRTNHGIEFAWAGFQYGQSEKEDMWRKSSETRKKLAEKAVKNAKDPKAMLEAMAQKMDDNLQMNLFRVELKPRQMRTIFQWTLIPRSSMVILRPIQAIMKIKVSKEKIGLEVLDNQIIKKIYDGSIKHFCKIAISSDEKEIRTIQTEQFLSFYDHAKNGGSDWN